MAMEITALYGCLDDVCKVLEDWEAQRLIPAQQTSQHAGKLSRSEMLLIHGAVSPRTVQAFQGVLP